MEEGLAAQIAYSQGGMGKRDHHIHLPRVTLGRMQNPVRGFLHGTTAIVAIAGGIWMIVSAEGAIAIVASAVFALGLVALFSTSSLYHSFPWREVWKARMQRLDHSMIFVLIAATWTPIALLGLTGWLRWVTLIGVWTIASVGIAQQAFFPRENKVFGVALMTTLGWLAVLIVLPLAQRAGLAAVIWLGAGGAAYTIGLVFLATERPRLWPRVFSYHEVFHILVVAGSVAHFVATKTYLLPLAV